MQIRSIHRKIFTYAIIPIVSMLILFNPHFSFIRLTIQFISLSNLTDTYIIIQQRKTSKQIRAAIKTGNTSTLRHIPRLCSIYTTDHSPHHSPIQQKKVPLWIPITQEVPRSHTFSPNSSTTLRHSDSSIIYHSHFLII